MKDLFWGVVVLVALGLGAGIMNNLVRLTAEFHTELEALRQLLESRLRKPNLDPLTRLAVALLREKSESHKCPECGALPVFEANYDDDKMGKEGEADTLGRFLFPGREGGGWRYTYHFADCSRREPGTAVVTSTKEEQA